MHIPCGSIHLGYEDKVHLDALASYILQIISLFEGKIFVCCNGFFSILHPIEYCDEGGPCSLERDASWLDVIIVHPIFPLCGGTYVIASRETF